MDQKGESNVPIAGISDKRSITATFSITLDNKLLPMQLIYRGKTGQSLPKVKFTDGFSLSVNESHYSNENEALKFIEEIILPTFEISVRSLDIPIRKPFLSLMFFGAKPRIKSLKFWRTITY